jgi:hypothetical protein
MAIATFWREKSRRSAEFTVAADARRNSLWMFSSAQLASIDIEQGHIDFRNIDSSRH